MNTRNILSLCGAAAFVTMLAIAGCKKEEFSEDYDINWPVPKINSFTPAKDTVGKTITITGEQFDKIARVTIGEPETEAEIISNSTSEIVVRIPRLAKAGVVKVYTNFKRSGKSEEIFTPIYLDAKVTSWPARITRGQAFVIRGDNMDMIQEVEVNGTKVAIAPTPGAATDQLTVTTQGMTLPDKVVVRITKAMAGIENGVSGEITVQDPSQFFIPEAPVVLFDFENGTNPFVTAGGSPTSGLNLSGAPKARGEKYLTVQQAGAANWTYLGEAQANGPIDLTKFHKPHLTFLVNTRNKPGYFQFEVSQAGTKWGMHFKPAYSPFDYLIKTTGWTWVSVPLEPGNFEKWGGSGSELDPLGILEYAKLGFSTANGAGDWEINLDQIMITDGAVKPVFAAFTFEDGGNPYSGSANSGLNTSGIPTLGGNNYLTVSKSGVANWDWTGEINKNGPIDLSGAENAYINFWVNTNGKKGFFQIETTQSGVKWGGNLDVSDYFVETNGWKLYSLKLSEIGWGKWGGSGTATALDPKGILDYIKIGFSTGNVSGAYEVNIDDVYISDGPMF